MAHQKSRATQPDRAEAYPAMITLHCLQHAEDGARWQAAALKSSLPKHALVQLYDAQDSVARCDFKRASVQLEDLLGLLPDNVALLHPTGANVCQLNSLLLAEAALRQAVQLQPRLVGARRLLTKVCLLSNQPAKVLSALASALASEGRVAEASSVQKKAVTLALAATG
jgi:Flp pilus assembly protein TadD